MPDTPTIDGNVQNAAYHRLTVMIGLMANRKKTPCDVAACEAIAHVVAALLAPAQITAVACGEAEDETARQIRWSVNNILDMGAARVMVSVFARAAGIAAVLPEDEDRLSGVLLAQLKPGNPVTAPDVIWPPVETLVRQADTLVGLTPPIDIMTLERALLAAAAAWREQ